VKDFPNILTAFFEVARLNSKMSTLLIAGDGPLRSEMQEFASREGLGDRVRFLGPRNDIGDLMTASDGLVLASQEEGLSLVLLEAASHGLPIVATDVGGNRETIPEENTGYLVPARDSHALADAMQALMNLPDEMRLAVGHRARKNAERRFALSEILNEWEEVYRELLGRRGLPDNLIAKRAAAD
jgi:glycosyltransferase involved in cell wall biosynthesis